MKFMELSKEFQIAVTVYRHNQRKIYINFTKLANIFKNFQMIPKTVMNGLRTCQDFGIIENKYGETEKGFAGRTLHVSPVSEDTISQLYDGLDIDCQKFLEVLLELQKEEMKKLAKRNRAMFHAKSPPLMG